jgi:hypothetical protein
MIKILNKHNTNINSPIGEYLPQDIIKQNPDIGKITWEELVTHKS